MKFIKKHKYSLIIVLIFIILFVLAFFAMKELLYPDSEKDIYGDRLDGIENYPISDETVNVIIAKITDTGKINDVTYRLEGRQINFIIDVKKDTSLVTAKSLGDIILENLEDDIKGYYDIELMITSDESEEDDIFPIIGKKHKSRVGFVW